MSAVPGARRQRVKFTVDWDKLRAPSFATIRSWRQDKEEFYRAHLGETFNLIRVSSEWQVRGPKIGEATLVGVQRVVPADLPVELITEDVLVRGKPDPEWLARISRMADGLLLRFENHTGLLA